MLAFLVAFALSATRVRTAALLVPCEEQTPVEVTNADRHLRKALGPEGFKLPKDTGWTVLGQRGDKDAWEMNWEVWLDTNPAEFLQLIDAKLSEAWTRISGDTDPEGARSVWQFLDEEGKQWNAVAAVESEHCGSHSFRLSIKLARNYSPQSMEIRRLKNKAALLQRKQGRIFVSEQGLITSPCRSCRPYRPALLGYPYRLQEFRKPSLPL